MTNTDWLTLALVVITAIYAWATFRILRANEAVVSAMKEQTEAQLRPYVVASVAPRIGTTLMLLEIQNAGRSPATNLRLRMDKDFYPHAEKRDGENIAALSAFTEPIESLAPGTRMQFILGVGGTIFAPGVADSLCPKVFTVSATYEHAGRAYDEEHTIDLRPMLRSAAMQDPVAEEVKRLRESLEKLLKR
ncbi:hypothetical protein [Piscinibacter defluvii]|uniref:hypothetical protein n=1 Tax=Piscinibacter defluvii TaxID=1796922 RepID=UPI000FDDCB30|nr:hypothetical protein [Piscinibacter defluvii]